MTEYHPERKAAAEALRFGATDAATVHALLYVGDQIGTLVTNAVAHAMHLREKDVAAIKKHDADLLAMLERTLGRSR